MNFAVVRLMVSIAVLSIGSLANAANCLSGTIEKAWVLGSGYRAPLSVIVKTGNKAMAFPITHIISPSLGTGKINWAHNLRADAYGKSAIELTANFPSVTKAFYTRENQPVCVWKSGNSYGLEFIAKK